MSLFADWWDFETTLPIVWIFSIGLDGCYMFEGNLTANHARTIHFFCWAKMKNEMVFVALPSGRLATWVKKFWTKMDESSPGPRLDHG